MSTARSKFALYIDTTPATTPTYVLVGKGITEAMIAYNPQTTTEQDIISTTGTTDLTGYQPSLPIKVKFDETDPACAYLETIRKSRAILDDAISEIVMVYLFDTEVTGTWPAEKQAVTVQIDDFGGSAADPLELGATLSFRGDGTTGYFNPTTKAFT